MPNVFSWRQAIQKSELPAVTRHVLLNLSLYMNELGESCFPSVEAQVLDTGLSKRTVITHLQVACDSGFLIKRTHGYSGQQWKRNEYYAAYPESFNLARSAYQDLPASHSPSPEKGGARDALPLEEKGGASGAQGGASHDTKAVQEMHLNSPENSPKKSPSKKYTKKSALMSLVDWERHHNKLCIQHMAAWVKEKRLRVPEVEALIEEFRDVMVQKDLQYADFVAAFKNYLRRGYLSKGMERIRDNTTAGGVKHVEVQKGLSL